MQHHKHRFCRLIISNSTPLNIILITNIQPVTGEIIHLTANKNEKGKKRVSSSFHPSY